MEGSFARALYSFQSTSPGELSVPEGGIIRITQYIDNHWLEAEYQGETGFFPITYAVRLKDEPQLHNIVSSAPLSNGRGFHESIASDELHKQNHFSERRQNSGRSLVEAAFAFEARNESELTFPPGALLEVTKDVDEDWLEGSFSGRTGLFPKSYVKSLERPCARAIYPFVGESAGELTFREGDCIFLRKRLNSQWMEGEINGSVGLFPSSFVAVEVELPPEEGTFSDGDFFFVDLTPKQENQKDPVVSKIQWKKGMKGKAMFHFTALYSGDLELNKGDIVTVLRVDDENWLEGQLANGLSGSCPTAYLESVYDTCEPFANKNWNAMAQRFASDKSSSGISSFFAPNPGTNGTSKYSSRGILSQQGNDFSESDVNTASSKRSLLDSSFTQDPTPLLTPSNVPALAQENETGGRSKRLLVSKPALKAKPSEAYSVTYLGRGSKNLPPSKNNQTTISPSISVPSLSYGNASVRNSYASDSRVTTVFNGVSGQSNMIGSSSSCYHDSAGTWPRKRTGIGECVFQENKNRQPLLDDDDDDDMLSGNCTSLPSPLLPLPLGDVDDDNIESSASEDSPITPRRPAPPPPKRNISSMNQSRSSTLPATRSKGSAQGQLNQEALPSKSKDWQISGCEDVKRAVSTHESSRTRAERDSSPSPKGSPKLRTGCNIKNKPLSRPHSLHWKERGTGAPLEKSLSASRHSNSLEELNQNKTSSVTAVTGSASQVLVKYNDEHVANGGKSPEETNVPGLVSLEERIAETEQNLKKEMNVHAGFKSIAQLVMTDPAKQREMEVKVSQSQQKITEWQEELKHLKDEKVFLIESHRKKTLKNKIAKLEADLEKQARSQRSLEMLLGVVEENRKSEVMENLGVCAQLVEKIKNELTQLEASLHCLTEKPAASSQKHMAEQRQRVVTELVNTERDFCNDLELCVKYFLLELRTAQVKDLDCEGLFGNIEGVLETSQKLLKGLESAIDNKEGKDQELGKCFVDIAEEMKEVYAVYCRNHDDAISLMEKYEEMLEIQDAFSRCLDKIREHTRCWDLSSFLIKPVQRVLKYPLLLNELFKYTPEIHRDKYNLLKAISVMTDVANAINEFKRRKDLVVKYKKVEDSGLTNMIQKLSWHSVVKKSTRFNQRLTQLTGLVSQTVDERFIEEEKRFRGIEKTVKILWKNVSTFLEEFQETMEFGQASGENINDFYQDAATSTEVSTFHRIQKTIGETILIRFMDSVQVQVLSPLNSLLSLFQGPQRLIQKRNDKCLDYDRWSNKIDKIKDRDKLKAAKEELELAKKNYEALNTQLLEEIPGFNEQCMALVVDCLKNFAVAQNRLYHEIQQEYEQLLQLPILQTVDGDIVEHHNKRSMQVMEQFSNLSFIPCSFVVKDSSRKKRRSLKSPNAPSNDPDTTEDDRGIKTNLVDYKEGELGKDSGVGKTQHAHPPPSTILQPRPAPRRMSGTTRPDPKQVGSSEIVEVAPGEGKLYMVEFNFEAQNAGELSVSEGDLVSVVRHSDSSGNPEWWLVQHNGATGYVPQSFLFLVSDNENNDGDGVDNAVDNDDKDDSDINSKTTQDTNNSAFVREDRSVSSTNETDAKLRYYAEFAFEASSAAELSLKEGQLVAVLQKRDLTGNDEWWLVEANGHKGYVPSSYLTPAED